jgi:UDP-N-acetylglucosamine:LPS N-acetylglucosamine transferase
VLHNRYGIELPADKQSVCFMAGTGHWPEGLIKTTSELADSPLGKDLHIVAIAGTSEEAHKVLSDKVDQIFPYLEGMKLALLLKAVDYPCIKGGGGAIPDMIALNKAFIIFQALAGPEPGNTNWCVKEGVARAALTTEALIETFLDLRAHPEKIETMEAAQRLHYEKDSAGRIAGIIAKMAHSKLSRRIGPVQPSGSREPVSGDPAARPDEGADSVPEQCNAVQR